MKEKIYLINGTCSAKQYFKNVCLTHGKELSKNIFHHCAKIFKAFPTNTNFFQLALETNLTAPEALREYSYTEIQKTQKSEDKYIYFIFTC